MLNKVLASIFMTGAILALQILVLMKGWGLHPQSWWWILGGGFVGMTVLKAIGERVLASWGPASPSKVEAELNLTNP